MELRCFGPPPGTLEFDELEDFEKIYEYKAYFPKIYFPVDFSTLRDGKPELQIVPLEASQMLQHAREFKKSTMLSLRSSLPIAFKCTPSPSMCSDNTIFRLLSD